MKQITCPHCADTYSDFDVAHVCSKGPYALRFKPKMNERIKELAEQAGFKVNWQHEDVQAIKMARFEKFAELIVGECIKLCEHESNDDEYDQYDMGQSVKAESIKTAIKEHFGVEE